MSEVIWWTGAAVWTVIAIATLFLASFLAWRALYATAEVSRQLWRHHVMRKKTRAEYRCSIGEAWWFAFEIGPEPGPWRWR